MKPEPRTIRYAPSGPVCAAFLASDAFVAGIRGPIGSGKSTACVMKIVRGVQLQKRGPDGVVRRRIAIIRNTYPELKTTTIKTWHQWIPANSGKWVDQGPPSHTISARDGTGTLLAEWEVIFVALDRPEDVRKLLSMELSMAWINEAREVPKAILDGLTGRVGRYPAVRDGGCTNPQIIMDTNAPDTDHWWARMADFQDDEMRTANERLEAELRSLGSFRPDQKLFEFFTQPGGREGNAENLKNLDPGYYLKAIAGKSPEWINIYVDGNYGFVIDGKPVYPEYSDNLHCRSFDLNHMIPIYIGIDFGLTPAAVFGQRTLTGQWRWFDELVTEDMGARRFGEVLRTHINDLYRDFQIARITGDPAGTTRSQSDETTPFEMLRAVGVEASPAPTNDFMKRREAVAMGLNRLIDSEPGLIIHPNCQKLRKAMSGGYCYKRIQGLDERFREVPDKNMFSHVADAAQYLMMGAGEGSNVVKRDPRLAVNRRQQFAIME